MIDNFTTGLAPYFYRHRENIMVTHRLDVLLVLIIITTKKSKKYEKSDPLQYVAGMQKAPKKYGKVQISFPSRNCFLGVLLSFAKKRKSCLKEIHDGSILHEWSGATYFLCLLWTLFLTHASSDPITKL